MPEIAGFSETTLRIGAFAVIFVMMAGLEIVRPRRVRSETRLRRWSTNLAIFGTATILIRLLAFLALPVAATIAALQAERLGWGVFNDLDLPAWSEMVLAIMLLDLAVWFQHVISHHVPVIWRFHRVHHADRDFDLTTALRFHPVEIALSALYKVGIVFLLGPTILAVIMFEILLNGSAMFNHANVKLPLWLDTILRKLFVTPDMHRVHHSIHKHEHDTNYGFFLSIWDRIFQTYCAQPKRGHTDMDIGLSNWQTDAPSKFTWSMLLPLR